MSQELDTRANEEYKKAIQLAGSHGEIYLNVGEKNFMRWNDLSAEDKQFTVDFLKELAERMDKEEFLELMDYWKNYVQDYSVMASILPDELRYYRMYANFLGEKSLSSHERHWAMAKAEAMRLSLAIEELKAGENAFMYRLIKKASAHFEACQEILERLKFYQNLTGDKFIEPEEYRTVQKKVSLRIAKCRLLEGQGLRDVQSYLLRYLDLEDDEMSVDELAAFLRKRGLIGEQLKSDLDDWNRLAFHMNLALKQGQIAEVVKVGRILESNRPSFPTKNVESFTKVMHMVGNALLRTGFFTDACTFYNRALETDPNNLDVLIALRESYERAGDEINSRKTWDRIEKMLSPRVQDYDDFRIQKGMNFSRTLKLDGEKLVLKLTFGTEDQNIKPLVSVWLDDRVIWENYLEGTVLSIPLEPRAGENTLTVVPINTDVVLKSIGYEVGIR